MGKSRAEKSTLNIIYSLFYQLLGVIVSFIVPRLFILNYGSGINGLQGSVTQVFTYIGLVEAGVGDASLQALYKPMADKDYDTANGIISATSRYYNKISVVYFILLFSAAAIYPLLVKVSGAGYLTVFLYIVFYGAGTGINFLYLSKIYIILKASGDIYIMTVIYIMTYIMSTIVKVAVILLYGNIVWIQVCYLLINMFFTYVCYLYAKKHFGWINFHKQPNNEAVRKKKYVFAHNINYMIFSNLDVTVLTFLCNLNVVSVYTTYRMILTALSGSITPFLDSINFVLGQKLNGKEKDQYCDLADSINVYYSAFAFALFSVMYILMIPFMRLYTAGFKDYNYIYPMIPLLYIIIESLTIGRDVMNRTINNAGHFRETFGQALNETIINVTVSIVAVLIGTHFFGQIYGLYGVLIGTIAAMAYRTIRIIFYANKNILHRKPWGTLKIWLSNTAILTIVALVSQFLKLKICNYWEFIIYGVVLTLIMMVLYLGIQSLINLKAFRYVKNLGLNKLGKYLKPS